MFPQAFGSDVPFVPVVVEPQEEDSPNEPHGGEVQEKRKRSRYPQGKPDTIAKYPDLFPEQGLIIVNYGGNPTLRCNICNTFISSIDKASVQQHVWGHRSAKKASTNCAHQRRKSQKARGEEKRGSICTYFKKHKPDRTDLHNDAEKVKFRAMVGQGLLDAGVPFHKMEIPSFRAAFEFGAFATGGRKGIDELQSSLIDALFESLKERLSGKQVALLFDGSTINHSIEVALVRFVENGVITHLAIQSERVSKAMDAEKLGQTLIQALNRVGVTLRQVLVAISDRARVNSAAVRHWRDVPFHGCLSHTLNNAGKKMDSQFVHDFCGCWKRLRTSPYAKTTWKALTGSAFPTCNSTRWWSWFELIDILDKNWIHVLPTLRECQKKNVAEKSVKSMIEILCSSSKRFGLRLEMKYYILQARPYVKAGYSLESKKMIAPYVQQIIAELKTARLLNRDDDSDLEAIIQELTKNSNAAWSTDYDFMEKWKKYVCAEAKKMHDYWSDTAECRVAQLRRQLDVYEAVSFFCPFKLAKLFSSLLLFGNSFEEFDQISIFASFEKVPGFSRDLIRKLQNSFPQLLVCLKEAASTLRKLPFLQMADQAWDFWKAHQNVLPAWWEAAKIVALLSPSSAAAEGFFSVAKGVLKRTQSSLLPEHEELKVLSAYNQRSG